MVFPLLSVPVSVWGRPDCFMSRTSCVSSEDCFSFVKPQALNSSIELPRPHISSESFNYLALSCFFFPLWGLSTGSPIKPPILIMNKNKPWLFWSGVCELWRRTSKERREWQLVLLLVRPPDKIRVTGEHGTQQVPPSCPSTLLAAPIWPLTSPSLTNMSIPLWLFSLFSHWDT